MIEVPIFKIKHEEAFTLTGAYIDNAFRVIYRLSKKYKLIHIIDEDAKKGKRSNFPVYDKATYHINIQVEGAKQNLYGPLRALHVRVVVPPEEEPKEFTIAKIFDKQKIPYASRFKDILTIDDLAPLFPSTNRLFIYGTSNKYFARINPSFWSLPSSFF